MSEYPRAFIRWITNSKNRKCHHRWHAHVLTSHAEVPDDSNLAVTGENRIITPAEVREIEVQVQLAREAAAENETPC